MGESTVKLRKVVLIWKKKISAMIGINLLMNRRALMLFL